MGDTMGRPLPDIIIPTCRSSAEVAPLVCELEGYSWPCRVCATCQPVSAATNRNSGLAWAQSDIVFMCDDDTQGFYPGWWEPMARILREDPGVCMVSARLLRPDGTPGLMMFPGDTAPPITYVPRLPTACVAFWREKGIAFDEEFIGSGFEDDDFCALLRQRHPHSRYAISNLTRIVHLNERKHQTGPNWNRNKAHFESKWMTLPNEERVPREMPSD